MRRRLGILVAGLLLVTSVASAQLRGGWGFYSVRWATPTSFDGAFVFCRAWFRPNPYGDGANWSVDYPRADQNLMYRLSELTKTSVSRSPGGDYNHVVVGLTDPLLFHCPSVMMTEVGNLYFDPSEAAALRAYLEKGGGSLGRRFLGHDGLANLGERDRESAPVW